MTNEVKNAVNLIKEYLEIDKDIEGNEYLDSLRVMVQALEQQPSEDILDKIRAEILDEAEYAYADFDQYKEDVLYAEPDELPDDDFRYGMERAVEIINKYKAESEDKQ